jgi:hypothetical protein
MQRRHPLRRLGEDRGYVAALTALLIVPLLLFTGFAVDLGSWTARASRAQAAADSAALAGVVYLPDRPDIAVAKAKETAQRNGYTDGVGGVTVTVTPLPGNELEVEIFDPDVDQFFSSVFVEDPTITRGARSEFIRPVPMGSPETLLGQDPENGVNNQYVLNIAGPSTNKQNGDKRTAKWCAGSFAGCSPPNSAHSNNTDYSQDGYYFTVNVDDTAVLGSDPLSIQVYDPAYVYNNDGCGANQLSDAQRTTLNANHPGDPYWDQRYQSGRTIWCTGDQRLAATGGSVGSSIVTTYIVRAPDDTPSDVTDNPAICAISFDPWGDPGQGSNPWPAGMGNLFDLLNSNTARGRENVVFRDHYRKWFPICTIPAGSVQEGEYVVQVRTNADLSDPSYSTTADLASGAGSLENAADPLPNTGGHNRHMIRAGLAADLTGAPASVRTGISLSALGHLPIYMNQIPPGGAQAEFYLARILPETAGKTLQLTFWDMADISGGSATFQLVSPPDATVPLDDCTFTRDGAAPPGVTITGCTIAGITTSNYNGRNVIVKIPIPGGYDCASGDPLGCWTKVRVSVVGAGATPSDTTTWSATMTGDPVRLIR